MELMLEGHYSIGSVAKLASVGLTGYPGCGPVRGRCDMVQKAVDVNCGGSSLPLHGYCGSWRNRKRVQS